MELRHGGPAVPVSVVGRLLTCVESHEDGRSWAPGSGLHSFIDVIGDSIVGRVSLDWTPEFVASFGFALARDGEDFVDVGWFLAGGPRGCDPRIVFDEAECIALLAMLEADDVAFRSIVACLTRFEPHRDAEFVGRSIDPLRLVGAAARQVGEWVVANNKGKWSMDVRGRKTLYADPELGVGITWRGSDDVGFPWTAFDHFLAALSAHSAHS